MATEVSEMLDQCRERMNRALQSLDRCQERVIKELEKSEKDGTGYNDKLGSHLAWMVGKVAEVTSALRQLERHDRQQSKSPEQRRRLFHEAIKRMPSHERAEIAELLGQLEQRRELLA